MRFAKVYHLRTGSPVTVPASSLQRWLARGYVLEMPSATPVETPAEAPAQEDQTPAPEAVGDPVELQERDADEQGTALTAPGESELEADSPANEE